MGYGICKQPEAIDVVEMISRDDPAVSQPADERCRKEAFLQTSDQRIGEEKGGREDKKCRTQLFSDQGSDARDQPQALPLRGPHFGNVIAPTAARSTR
jgi:hypothetical protein